MRSWPESKQLRTLMNRLGLCMLCAGLCSSAMLTVSTPAFADEVEITDEARQHFKAGVNFMQDPDGARYEEAYREFKAAYKAAPSWKILGNLGIAAMKLERDGEAIDAMQRYLEQGGAELPAEERAQFERDISTLKASVVRVILTSVPPGVVVTDERHPVQGAPITNRYVIETGQLELGIRAGHHRMVARLQGYEDQIWEFDAASGSDLTHAFEMKVPAQVDAQAPGTTAALTPGAVDVGASPAMERPTPTGVYIGLAATGAFTLGAAVTGVLALGKKGDFDDANDGTNPADAESLSDSTKTLNLVTDVLIGAAVASAAVTTYLYVSRPAVPVGQETARFKKADGSKEATRLKIQPLVGRDTAFLSLEGSF